jgi:hypothetical protein
VSGEDFELAHRGFFKWLYRSFFGASAKLDVRSTPSAKQKMPAAPVL